MNNRITLTEQVARAAAGDAGSASMRKGRRTKWSKADYNAAARTYARLMPEPKPAAAPPRPKFMLYVGQLGVVDIGYSYMRRASGVMRVDWKQVAYGEDIEALWKIASDNHHSNLCWKVEDWETGKTLLYNYLLY